MGSAFYQLCPRCSGTLTPTAPTAIRLLETFTFLYGKTKFGGASLSTQEVTKVAQGPVVQSIISSTSSLRGQLFKCFTTL